MLDRIIEPQERQPKPRVAKIKLDKLVLTDLASKKPRRIKYSKKVRFKLPASAILIINKLGIGLILILKTIKMPKQII